MTTLKPDAFEEIFLKLEEESERRALAAEEAMPSPNVPDPATAARQERQRSRGSISISRFGHIEDGTQRQTSPGLPPPTFVHGMTTFTPFYGMQSHNPSADSLSADSFFGDDAGLSAESDHVTQVHRIAGRQSLPRSVGGILQRTLTRSWTSGALSLNDVSNSSVVVGVVVEEDHREEPEPREGIAGDNTRRREEGNERELEKQSGRAIQAKNPAASEYAMAKPEGNIMILVA